MDKLNEWFKPFESIERLSFEETKELLKQARESGNESLKQQLYNEVILGTMYVLYEYIKDNKLYNVAAQDFDMDDLTSSFTRQWITLIKTVDINQFNSFEQVLSNYRLRYKSLTGMTNDQSSESVERTALVTSRKLFDYDQIREFFKDYVSAIKLNGECTVSDLGYYRDYRFDQYDDSLVALIAIFDDLYFNSWDPKRYEKGVLSLEDYRVISARLRTKSEETVSIFDQDIEDESSIIDEKIDRMFHEKIIGDALETLTAQERTVIEKYYGLGTERRIGTIEIAAELGLSSSRINQIINKAIAKIRFFLVNHSKTYYSFSDLLSQGLLLNVKEIMNLEYQGYLSHEEAYLARRLFTLEWPASEIQIQQELNITKEEYDIMLQNIMKVLREQRFIRYDIENYSPSNSSGSRS